MTINVMKEYLKIVQEELTTYMKLIFEKKYNRKITLRYLDAYMNVRFYNFYIKDENLTFRKNYLNAIKEEEQKILDDMPKKKKLIEDMGLFFYYILYFDKISYRVDTEEIVEKLYKIRKRILKKDNPDFKKDFYNTYKAYTNIKNQFLTTFNTDKFILKIADYEGTNNANRVILRYTIEESTLYNTQAYETAFSEGIVFEDKLFVEYYLITAQVIQDILKGNFKKQYIVEFNPNLLKKNRKLNQLLEIINNSAIQDKVNIRIEYADFIKNKDKVYDLMRNGYRLAIVLDNTFEPEYANFQRLNAFNYILANKKLKYFDKILLNEQELNGLIKI